jgi:hypothetical protein
VSFRSRALWRREINTRCKKLILAARSTPYAAARDSLLHSTNKPIEPQLWLRVEQSSRMFNQAQQRGRYPVETRPLCFRA